MPDWQNVEAVFLQHLGWIDKVAAIACRKQGIWGDEAEDFTAQVRMKIMEDDYGVLRKFRGESELKTYLATVVNRHVSAYGREQRGRWRVSAMAQRRGPPAPELEMLVHRDGYTLQQAGTRLRLEGRTDMSDAELARLLSELPDRDPLRPVAVDSEVLETTKSRSRADELVVAEETGKRRREVMGALESALAQLDLEDRMIVQMHYRDGISVANVARTLHLEQKPLYRRVERLSALLRGLLEKTGLAADDVRELLDDTEEP